MDSHQRLTLINERLQSIQEIDIPGAETFADMKQTYQTVKDALPLIKAGLKGAAIAGPAGVALGFAGRKALKYTVGKPLAAAGKLGARAALAGAKAGGKLAVKGAKKGSKIARRVATRINDTLLTGRDRKFKQNIQDPVVRTTGKALKAAGRGISKAAGVVKNRVRGMMKDGVEYEDLLVIHEDIRKRLKGPKAPIGKSNPAIRPSSEQTPPPKIGTGRSGVGVKKKRGSSAEGRRNLIKGVLDLSKTPSPEARESLRKLARAADRARRLPKDPI